MNATKRFHHALAQVTFVMGLLFIMSVAVNAKSALIVKPESVVIAQLQAALDREVASSGAYEITAEEFLAQ